jgi:hypothetical protein
LGLALLVESGCVLGSLDLAGKTCRNDAECGLEPTLRCVEGVCVPGEGEGEDRDADGVPDGRDNCLDVGNAEQSDHDDDGVGTACDNCPVDPNPDQSDDGERQVGGVPDALGDACDPFPADEGDVLLALETFADGIDADVWTPVPDARSWSTAQGAAVPPEPRGILAWTVFDLTLETWSARAVFEVRSVPAVPAVFGLAATGTAGGWTVCGLRQSSTETTLDLFRANEGGDALDPAAIDARSFTPQLAGRLVFGSLRTEQSRTTCGEAVFDHGDADAAQTPALLIDDGVAVVRAFAVYFRPR